MKYVNYVKKQLANFILKNAWLVKKHSVEIAIEEYLNLVDSAKGGSVRLVRSVFWLEKTA